MMAKHSDAKFSSENGGRMVAAATILDQCGRTDEELPRTGVRRLSGGPVNADNNNSSVHNTQAPVMHNRLEARHNNLVTARNNLVVLRK